MKVIGNCVLIVASFLAGQAADFWGGESTGFNGIASARGEANTITLSAENENPIEMTVTRTDARTTVAMDNL